MSSVAVIAMTQMVFAQDVEEGADTEIFTPLGRIVLGAGADKVAIDAPQSITVLDRNDVDRVQPSTIGDVVERVPGVSTVGSESRFGESFNIRGIGGGTSADEPRIVVLIDGVKKYYESYRQGSLFTDPEFYRSIEILRGPSSSTLYGAGAVAGVISLETRRARDFLESGEPFSFTQKLEYKSNGDGIRSASYLAFAPNEQLEFLLGYIYDDSDFQEDGSGNRILGTEIRNNNTLLNGSYRFGEGLDHTVEFGWVRYDGTADDQLLDVIDNATTFGLVDREVVDDTAYIKYSYQPSGNDLIDLSAQVYYSNSENNITNFRAPPFVLDLFDADYQYETTGIRIDNTSAWIGGTYENFLTFGVDYADQDRISTRASFANAAFQPEGTTKTTGIFAQNEYIWQDRFTVLTGARIDFQETTPGALVPTTVETDDEAVAATLALHYQINDNFAVFGSASYTERLPVIDELYDSRSTPGGADQVSAGTLDPETSQNFELGVSYTQNDVFNTNNQISMKGVFFRNNLDDLIARNNFGTAGEPTFVNVDEAVIEGFELEAAYASDTFFGSLALTIIDGENKSDPNSPNPDLEDRIPADTLTLLLGTQIPDYNVELGWTGTYYRSKSRAQSAMGMVQTIDTPSEFVQDIYAAWRPDTGVLDGTEFRLSVSNVTDEDYRTHLQNPMIRRAGRSFNFTVQKTF